MEFPSDSPNEVVFSVVSSNPPSILDPEQPLVQACECDQNPRKNGPRPSWLIFAFIYAIIFAAFASYYILWAFVNLGDLEWPEAWERLPIGSPGPSQIILVLFFAWPLTLLVLAIGFCRTKKIFSMLFLVVLLSATIGTVLRLLFSIKQVRHGNLQSNSFDFIVECFLAGMAIGILVLYLAACAVDRCLQELEMLPIDKQADRRVHSTVSTAGETNSMDYRPIHVLPAVY